MTICASCCKQSAKLRCSRCKSAFYCDVSCQSKHWEAHKISCRAPSSNEFSGSSSSSSRISSISTALEQGSLSLKEVPRVSEVQKNAPKAQDFPWELRDFSYSSSGDGVDENLLILLHGLGDVHKNFFQLGQKMELPQTAVMAISGPIMFPEEIIHGRAWFVAFDEDWELIQPEKGDERRLKSMRTATILLDKVIEVMCKSYGWTRDRVHVLGFSQGGTLALDLALRSCGPRRLGSVVAISASLLPEFLMQELKEEDKDVACGGACTSVLITHGSQDNVVSKKEVRATRDFISKIHPSVQVGLQFFNKEHCMVKSKEEMEHLMRFWSQHLHRRMVNMEKDSTLYEVSHRQ